MKFQIVKDRVGEEIKSTQAVFEQEKQAADAHISSWQNGLESQLRRLNSLQQKLGKRSDTESTKKPGFLRSVVDRLSPDIMASTAALKTRREATEHRIQELEESIATERVSLNDSASRRDTHINAAKRELSRAQEVLSETTDELNRKCDAELATFHLLLQEQLVGMVA